MPTKQRWPAAGWAHEGSCRTPIATGARGSFVYRRPHQRSVLAGQGDDHLASPASPILLVQQLSEGERDPGSSDRQPWPAWVRDLLCTVQTHGQDRGQTLYMEAPANRPGDGTRPVAEPCGLVHSIQLVCLEPARSANRPVHSPPANASRPQASASAAEERGRNGRLRADCDLFVGGRVLRLLAFRRDFALPPGSEGVGWQLR